MTAKVEFNKVIVEESVPITHLPPVLASAKIKYSFTNGISGQYRVKVLDLFQNKFKQLKALG